MEEMKRRDQKLAENVVYCLIWVVVFMVTVVGYNKEGSVQWTELGHFWSRAAPFFILFLVNNYLLLPRFFMRKRYGMYIWSALVAILTVTLFHIVMFRHLENKFPPHEIYPGDRPVPEYVMPPDDGVGPARMSEPPDRYDFRMPPRHPLSLRWGLTLSKFLLALLLVGFNIAVKLIFKTVSDARVMEQLERQNLQAELDYLRAQVNPHFFMNTLNNIHALVDIDTEKAKETIIELSKIMRYILYETDKPLVAVKEEVKFLENYVSLMSIRYAGNVHIDTIYPDRLPEARIPPLMLGTLLENAFKHGVSYRSDSFIKTEMTIQGERIQYLVRNSVPEKNGPERSAGMGLDNLRKRLTLLFGTDYRLKFVTRAGEHIALLEIPLEK